MKMVALNATTGFVFHRRVFAITSPIAPRVKMKADFVDRVSGFLKPSTPYDVHIPDNILFCLLQLLIAANGKIVATSA